MPIQSWLILTRSIWQKYKTKEVQQSRNFAEFSPDSFVFAQGINREALNGEETTSLLVVRHIFISSFLPEEARKKPLKESTKIDRHASYRKEYGKHL